VHTKDKHATSPATSPASVAIKEEPFGSFAPQTGREEALASMDQVARTLQRAVGRANLNADLERNVQLPFLLLLPRATFVSGLNKQYESEISKLKVPRSVVCAGKEITGSIKLARNCGRCW
jgi:hypothetical protein